ncbi:MAG: hypothetical protein ABSG03_09090 [Bryobacteraceae bacterium]
MKQSFKQLDCLGLQAVGSVDTSSFSYRSESLIVALLRFHY